MGELSFLTIIVSLAVCSLLVYAVFQYMKVRFTILEQSHKEQAMILQQYIEESATDIHRLYKLTTSGSNIHHPQGSIILEYANTDADADSDADGMKQKQSAYNEPHLIHLDTAIFSNNRSSNLIEISSDSEDTTECESTTEDEEDGDDATSQDDESTTEDEDEDDDEDKDEDEDKDKDEDTEKATEDADADADAACAQENKPLGYEQCLQIDTQSQLLVEEIVSELEKPSHIKLVTVDLGASDEPIQGSQEKNAEFQNDVLSMLYKKAQNTENPEIVAETITTTTTPSVSLHHLSVQELRQMLKEKYKHQPEKYAENQKLKKGELIQLLSAL
jgi:3-methyladenine DNA glycosylase AlkC